MKIECLISVMAGVLILAIAGGAEAQPQLMTLSKAAYPQYLTPDALADVVSDQSSGFTIDAATVAINNEQHPNAETDPRAIGLFGGGNVTPGTSLQDPVDPTAVFAGGIGMQWGVCLCTGFLSNNEPTRPPGIPSQLAVGVELP